MFKLFKTTNEREFKKFFKKIENEFNNRFNERLNDSKCFYEEDIISRIGSHVVHYETKTGFKCAYCRFGNKCTKTKDYRTCTHNNCAYIGGYGFVNDVKFCRFEIKIDYKAKKNPFTIKFFKGTSLL